MQIHITDFNLRHSLEAGQCFEWRQYKKGYAGILNGSLIYIYQQGDTLIAESLTESNFDLETAIKHYFSLDIDYPYILSQIVVDSHIKEAIALYHGVRVVKQPHLTAFVSFLLSANTTVHNTKMALGLIAKNFGTSIYIDPETNEAFFSFPDLATLQKLSEQDLRACKTGFRAPYLYAALQEITIEDLDRLNSIPYEEAKSFLLHFKGIGEKIADCILLYSYDFSNIYPTDTWVKQFTQKLYFPGRKISEKEIRAFGLIHFNGYAGWAQLFLFIASREKQILLK